MTQSANRFADDVLACVDDINTLLPTLFRSYDERVVVTAMAEHIGWALRLLMESGDCSPRVARRLLRLVESTAFLKAGVPSGGAAPFP